MSRLSDCAARFRNIENFRGRGAPIAGQNPDPSWFGQRGRGESPPHEDPVIERFVEYRADLEARAVAAQGEAIARRAEENIYTTVIGRSVTRVATPQSQTLPGGESMVGNWDSFFLISDERRNGDGYEVRMDQTYGGKLHGRITISTDALRGLTPVDIADAIEGAIKKLAQRKRGPQPNYLHPGSRKLSLD